MHWTHAIAAFFAGAFLANAVPHYIKGVAGDKFPTPFAQPPGRGLSPAIVNVLWALFNIAVGLWLLRPGHVPGGGRPAQLLCAAGFATMSILLGLYFPAKQAA